MLWGHGGAIFADLVWVAAIVFMVVIFARKFRSIRQDVAQSVDIFSPKVYKLFNSFSNVKIRLSAIYALCYLCICVVLVPVTETVLVFVFNGKLWIRGSLICISLFDVLLISIVCLIWLHQTGGEVVKFKGINPKISFLGQVHFVSSGLIDDNFYAESSSFFAKISELNLGNVRIQREIAINFSKLLLCFSRASNYVKNSRSNFPKQMLTFDGPDGQLSLDEMIKKVDEILSSCEVNIEASHVSKSMIVHEKVSAVLK